MSGPTFCSACGQWPAANTAGGPLCIWCETMQYAAAHPVPLPRNREALEDLADAGYEPARAALESIPTVGINAGTDTGDASSENAPSA